MSEKKVFSYNWGGRQLTVEIGQLAKQANGAVLVRYGDTVVLTAAVGTKQAKIQISSVNSELRRKKFMQQVKSWRVSSNVKVVPVNMLLLQRV